MKAAVVNKETLTIENIIVADAENDRAPDGFILVNVNRIECDIGWVYIPDQNKFYDPDPKPIPPYIGPTL